MYKNRFIISLRPVAMALLAFTGADQALAGDDDTPLSLTLAQFLTRDNNLAKDDSNKSGETISTSVAQIGLNKSYGRQTYQATAKLSAQKYKNFDQLNNNGKNLNASFSTGLFRDWLISANGSYDEALNAIQNNDVNARLSRNIRKFRDGGFSVQYGNGGTWAIAASYDNNKTNYSLGSQQYQNADQTSKGLRAIYFASDVLSYSLGYRRVITDYPSNPSYSQVVDRNIDLSANLQITGLSNLNATLTRRSTSYVPDDIAGNSGLTGSLNWAYTPHGILSYNLGFSRTTGTDRQKYGQQEIVGQSGIFTYTDLATTKINNNTITSGLTANARAQLTGKISTNLGYTVTQFKVDRTTTKDYVASVQKNSGAALSASSYYHAVNVGADYQALRSLSFGCSYQRYSQGADGVYRVKYTGNSIDCNASFTLD